MRIITIGSGILGLSVALNLARKGASVELIDSQGTLGRTSETSYAWTNASGKLDPNYHQLNVAGMEEHRVLHREFGVESSYTESGGLFIADAAQESGLRERLLQLEQHQYPFRLVNAHEAEELSGITPRENAALITYFPKEGYVLPKKLMHNLRIAAETAGVQVTPGVVRSIADHFTSVSVELMDGQVIHADRVVLAAGRWSKSLALTAGIDLPMHDEVAKGSATIGVLGYALAPQLNLRAVVHEPTINLRPSAPGQVVVQALDLNPQADPASATTAGDPIGVELQNRFIDLTGIKPERFELRLSARSLPADGMPIVGSAHAGSNVYTLVSHSGVTLGPLLGKLAAAEILEGTESDLLSPYRIGRFEDGSRSFEAHIPTRIGEQ